MPGGIIGLLIMPITLALMLRKDRGPVSKFMAVGATAPETARRPASLKIDRAFMLERPIRSGILVATGDGRYWVDLAARRRATRRAFVIATILAIVGAAAGWVLWPG